MKERRVPTIDEVKQKALPILARYGVRRAGVFGSLVRGELRQRSDIDLLVEIAEPISLYDLVGLKLELEKALGRKVDVVEYEAIKPLLKDRILQEEVPIL